jgi:lipid-binding SYLF domain-containing protein
MHTYYVTGSTGKTAFATLVGARFFCAQSTLPNLVIANEGSTMSFRYLLPIVVLFAVARAEGQLLAPPSAPNQIVVDATNVLSQSVAMPSGLPQKMLADAQGIAIVPNMVRGAFVVGVQRGRGVLLVRDPSGAWQAPRMIEITGGSLGYQIGVQSTDLILVFRTPQSVTNVMRGTLKVGVDASAAAGPVGRQASAATDVSMKAEILSYSRARGAFAA